MHPRHNEAKHLFQTKQYKKAQKVLLDIISTNKTGSNAKYLRKLGDISCEFLDFNTAKQYYQQSLTSHPQNPSLLLKLGNILSKELNKTKEAISVYQKCLVLSPNATECLFEYAKTMENQHNYSKAKELYIQCLQIDNSKASVHYHYAKLLLQIQHSNNHNNTNDLNIDYLFQKACTLRPKITKYHYEYALFLQNKNQINKANKEFEIALKLSNYSDIMLLYRFGNFNLDCTKDRQTALKYLKKASDLQSNMDTNHTNQQSHSYITDTYLQLKQSMNGGTDIDNHEMDQKCDDSDNNNIQLIIYEFDEIVSYWNLYASKIEWVSTFELYKIFGGYDRINQLSNHFENVLQPNETPGNDSARAKVKIALISQNNAQRVSDALKRMKLYHYFTQALVIGSDNCEYYNGQRSKYDDIIKIKDALQITDKNRVLLIDNTVEMDTVTKQQLSSQCSLFYTHDRYDKIRNNERVLRGLTFNDFDHIECIVNGTEYVPCLMNINVSLMEINRDIYVNLRREVQFMEMNENICDLPAIKWLNQNAKAQSKIFISFAQYLRKVYTHMGSENIWSAAQILSELVRVSNRDGHLMCMYAKCLSYLRHVKDADYYFNEALNLEYKNVFKCLIGYGYHLLSVGYYYKAYVNFEKCLNMGTKPNCKLFVGLARCAQRLERQSESEQWFIRAFEAEIDWIGFYDKAHKFYAQFLLFHGRFDESVYHLQLCVKHNPCDSLTHYKMARIYQRLGKVREYECSLQKALEIDPYLARARSDYLDHFKEGYCEDVYYNDCYEAKEENKESKHEETKDGFEEREMSKSESEFERFMRCDLLLNAQRAKMYYQKMIHCKLNDIRCLLFEDGIEEIIKDKMCVTMESDFEAVMDKIKCLRGEYDRFVAWLRQWELYGVFYDCFDANAIYSMAAFGRNVTHKEELHKMMRVYCERKKKDGNNVEFDQVINRLWIAKRHF